MTNPSAPFLAVSHEVDHRAGESRITHRLGGDEQAPGQRAARRHGGTRLGHRQHQDDGHQQDGQRAVDARSGRHPGRRPAAGQTNGTQAIGTPASDWRAFSVAPIQLSPSGSRIDAGRTR